MTLGHAAESDYRGPLVLDGDPKGASVLVLGAGLAGMAAAYELRKAPRMRGGDRYVELVEWFRLRRG